MVTSLRHFPLWLFHSGNVRYLKVSFSSHDLTLGIVHVKTALEQCVSFALNKETKNMSVSPGPAKNTFLISKVFISKAKIVSLRTLIMLSPKSNILLSLWRKPI